jgi:hypothetical protein
MAHKKHYVLTYGDGEKVDLYCDVLRLGDHCVNIREGNYKKPAKLKWLIYNPRSPNSIQAALEMASRHANDNARVLTYLHLHNGSFVWGKDLCELFGTAALERVREVRYQYGWPIQSKTSRGRGPWWYGLFLDPPRRTRTIPRGNYEA